MTLKTSVRLPFSEGPHPPSLTYIREAENLRALGGMRNPRYSSTKLQRGHRVGLYIQEALKYCLQDWVCPSQFRGFVCFFLHKTIKCKSSSVGPAPESSAPRLAPFSRRSQGSAVEFPFCGSSHRMSNPLMSFQSHWPHQQATLWPLLELNHLGPATFAVNSRTQAEHVILPRLADVAHDVLHLTRVVHPRADNCSATTPQPLRTLPHFILSSTVGHGFEGIPTFKRTAAVRPSVVNPHRPNLLVPNPDHPSHSRCGPPHRPSIACAPPAVEPPTS